ncbi:MAG: hypothetical protein HY783_05470 [Chloroflexi bacterium]|nr:hypothetical protein [Chloroflexota bacterium]
MRLQRLLGAPPRFLNWPQPLAEPISLASEGQPALAEGNRLLDATEIAQTLGHSQGLIPCDEVCHRCRDAFFDAAQVKQLARVAQILIADPPAAPAKAGAAGGLLSFVK